MPVITPSFVTDLESNMRVITTREYDRLNRVLWWPQVMKTAPASESKSERVTWLLDTAKIKPTGKGGNLEFDDIVGVTTEEEYETAAAGLKIQRYKFEDLDGHGVNLAAHWSRQVGAYASYWPQKNLAKRILANGKTYDGKPFFATDHPLNPYDPDAGVFANVFTGAEDLVTGYPGALPIDDSVTVDEAVINLSKAIAYASVMRMPNGEDPRFMRMAALLVPPRLFARAVQITNAKTIAMATASGGAASADVEAVIKSFGLGQPIEAPELAAPFGGSDTDYYLAMEEITSDELGAFAYFNRTPFAVTYYGPQNDAQLARIDEFQWFTKGRNMIMSGHPFLLFKGRST